MANHMPLTPTRDGDYVSVKTPEGHFSTHEAKSGVSKWSKRYRYIGNFAQLLIFVSMALYVFGQVAYFTPVYSTGISGSLKDLWGVPKTQAGGRGGGGGGGGPPGMQGGGGQPGMGNAAMGGGAGDHGHGNEGAFGGHGNNTMGSGRGNSTMGGSRGNNTMGGGFGGRGNSTMGGGRGNGTVADGDHHGGRVNSRVGEHSDHGEGGRLLQAETTTTRDDDDEHGHGPPASGAPAGAAPGGAPGGPPGAAPGGTPASGKTNGGGGGGGGRGSTTKGHSEMVLPTYFLLFGMLPLFVSGLLIEFLRHFNLRRISSHYMLKFALVLRRKPSLFGRVSFWSYGEWIFFWAMCGGNIYVFYRYYSPRINGMKQRAKNGLTFNSYMETIALTFGYSCIFNMAFLFLPATRNCAWMEFFNISYANGIKYHRWLGVLTVLTGFLHCVGYYWVWIRQGRWQDQSLPCFDCSLAERKGYKIWFNVFGEIALIIFLFIGVTSIPIVRRKFYNVFYYSHQLLFLAVIFSVMHWGNIVWWIFPTFIVYCYSRAVSMSSNFSPIQVKELTSIDNDIVKVVLKRSPGRDGHYRVGQFLYLNVPAISKLQWHAFTISSSPRTSPTTVTVLLKSLGDWTKDLVDHANECKDKNVLPTVYVDGFYGASLEMYDEYSTVCLVGGGIGATPMFAILEDLAAKLENHETLQQKVVFIFSFRELALLEEVHPVLMRLKELDPQERYFKTHFYLTRLPSDDVLARRIDTDRLQGKHIQPTTYESVKTSPIAFTEPLRSRTYRALTFTTVVVVGVLLLVYLEFGGGKIQRGTNRYLWPLQQFVDPTVAMVAACVVFAYVFAERLSKRKAAGGAGAGASKELEMNVFQNVGTPALTVSDVHTYRDLLTHYNVVQGARPDTKALMTEAYEFHADASVGTYCKPVIGVFVSGPEAMKRAVEYAAHEIGTRHFDIHEEEFEM